MFAKPSYIPDGSEGEEVETDSPEIGEWTAPKWAMGLQSSHDRKVNLR